MESSQPQNERWLITDCCQDVIYRQITHHHCLSEVYLSRAAPSTRQGCKWGTGVLIKWFICHFLSGDNTSRRCSIDGRPPRERMIPVPPPPAQQRNPYGGEPWMEHAGLMKMSFLAVTAEAEWNWEVFAGLEIDSLRWKGTSNFRQREVKGLRPNANRMNRIVVWGEVRPWGISVLNWPKPQFSPRSDNATGSEMWPFNWNG